ncbi:DUF362 domain-containing protein [bacterium]|nr:DUF362 domain-containing protein [bacterium]
MKTFAIIGVAAAALVAVGVGIYRAHNNAVPTVYFTRDISPDGLVRAYHASGWQPANGPVGVKMSTGEPPASNYLRPELISDLIQDVNGTIVECNTAYDGRRAQSAEHWKVIREHGFLDVAPVDIQDEEGDLAIPVPNPLRISENYVGTHFANYPSYIILSHFKGHQMAGYGGALKNISIGFGSRMGKSWIHSGGTSKTNPWGGEQDAFLDSMADASAAVIDYVGADNMLYINVLNRISIDCDCNGNPAEPDIHDIGILVSTDPVAIDQAGIDMITAAPNNAALLNRIAERNGLRTIEAAEKHNLGSRKYKLIDLDK